MLTFLYYYLIKNQLKIKFRIYILKTNYMRFIIKYDILNHKFTKTKHKQNILQ